MIDFFSLVKEAEAKAGQNLFCWAFVNFECFKIDYC